VGRVPYLMVPRGTAEGRVHYLVVLIVLVVLCRVPNGAHGTVMLCVGYFTC